MCAQMNDTNCSIMFWNVLGLNMSAKREAAGEVAAAPKLAILCMQETRINI